MYIKEYVVCILIVVRSRVHTVGFTVYILIDVVYYKASTHKLHYTDHKMLFGYAFARIPFEKAVDNMMEG